MQAKSQAPSVLRRPLGDKFRQQRMDSWQPIVTPFQIMFIFIAIGIIFIPTGTFLVSTSDNVFEQRIVYDGNDPHDPNSINCHISQQDQGRKCTVAFELEQDVDGPLLVYYELKKFYQNHRIYVNSYSATQLMGGNVRPNDAQIQFSCGTSYMNGSQFLNPCGLIANSYFTDIITFDGISSSSSSSNPSQETILDETNLSIDDNKNGKIKQVNGFQYVKVYSISTTCQSVGLPVNCKSHSDIKSNSTYLFFYPEDEYTQYLYETYPKHISPIEGVTNEHFMVWIKTAPLSHFRKLYGRIHENYKKGDILIFNIDLNYEVRSFDGEKALIIGTAGRNGGKNPSLGWSYVGVGLLSLIAGFIFGFKYRKNGRPMGDPKYLDWGLKIPSRAPP